VLSPERQNLLLFLNLYTGLKINERIKYKLLSLTYIVLTTNQPQYLHNLISIQPYYNTRSSSMVTVAHQPTRSSLKITNRSFRYAAPCLWNKLPTDLCESRQIQSLFTYHTSVHHLLHHLHYHHLHLLLLVQTFILKLRLGFSANHFLLHRPFPFLSD